MTNASQTRNFINVSHAPQEQPEQTDCPCACASIDEFCGGMSGVSCKPSRRRLFIERRRIVDDRVETILVLVKSKPGGQTGLRRRSPERREDRCAILSARRRADAEAAREAIEEAFNIEPMGSKRRRSKPVA
jgi:hypothetical protein